MGDNPLAAWLQETQRPPQQRRHASPTGSDGTGGAGDGSLVNGVANDTAFPSAQPPRTQGGTQGGTQGETQGGAQERRDEAPQTHEALEDHGGDRAWAPLDLAVHPFSRRRWLHVATALAWVLVLVLGAVLVVRGSATPQRVDPAPSDADEEQTAARTGPPPTSRPDAGAPAAYTADSTADFGALRALAEVAVRSALAEESPQQFVESAETVALEREADVVVATVVTATRTVEDQSWGAPRPRWYGVLLRDGQVPRTFGEPWPLPVPEPVPIDDTLLTPSPDERLQEATTALRDAGLKAEVTRLRHLEGTALVVADVVRPGSGKADRIWLHDGPALRIAGLAACPPTGPTDPAAEPRGSAQAC